jgi:hypothetical protein
MTKAHEPTFVKILETDSLTDIALIKSVLEGNDVEYFIQNENMKFIRPFDPAILLVAEADAARTRELLKPLKLTYNWMQFGG